jgi:hypothetical protein
MRQHGDRILVALGHHLQEHAVEFPAARGLQPAGHLLLDLHLLGFVRSGRVVE